MNTDFKYFHWVIPKPDCELYGLYDVFDNQILLLTYDFDIAWQLKTFIKSKIVLEIVDFSTQIDSVIDQIDNSIVETWGLSSFPTHVFQDIKYRDQTRYLQDGVIRDFKIVKNNAEFDNFKKDLQQQLFFFHHCLFQATNVYRYSQDSFFYEHLLRSAELGESYQGCIDTFVDISYIQKQDPDSVVLKFMKTENLAYE
jgi:hypothetical protein